MKLRILVLVTLMLGLGLHAGDLSVSEVEAVQVAAMVADGTTVKDGYALLNSLLTLFENLPVEKKDPEGEKKVSHLGLDEVDKRLSQLSVDAKATLEAGLVDKIFFNRYRRMLSIFKMVTMPIIRGELLKDMFMREFNEFVWETTCEQWRWEDKDAIAKMAAAMEEEFVQMMTYLDTRQKREELKKKIGKRILPPPPPPPGKKKPEDRKPE